MAGKSRRVASRQAQLTQRKKRNQRGPRGIPTAEQVPVSVGVDPGADAPEGAMPSAVAQTSDSVTTAATTAAAVAPTPAPATPARSPSRSREERPAAMTYMVPELSRILVMAATGFAILIVLKFVL